MLLKVSEKASFWGFGDIWLSAFETDGCLIVPKKEPYEIDFDALSVPLRDAIKSGISRGVLIRLDKDEPVALPPKVEHQWNPISPVVQEKSKVSSTQKQVLQEKARNILDKNTNSIRRQVAMLKDILLLEELINLEKETKKRKTVLGFLQAQYQKVNPPSNSSSEKYYDNLVSDIEDEVITISMN